MVIAVTTFHIKNSSTNAAEGLGFCLDRYITKHSCYVLPAAVAVRNFRILPEHNVSHTQGLTYGKIQINWGGLASEHCL